MNTNENTNQKNGYTDSQTTTAANIPGTVGASATRHSTPRWPGLYGGEAAPHRVWQLHQAALDAEESQAALSRLIDSGNTTAANINIDYHTLRFCAKPYERHTTIDIAEITPANMPRLLITTSDYKYHNRLIKLIDSCSDPDAWQIEDIGWDKQYSKIYWITWSCPFSCLRIKGEPYKYKQEELKTDSEKAMNSHNIRQDIQ